MRFLTKKIEENNSQAIISFIYEDYKNNSDVFNYLDKLANGELSKQIYEYKTIKGSLAETFKFSINKDKTSAELANLLSVKEFAIKMLKNQISVFSVKQLKVIVDMIAEYDRKIKFGEMKESIAIKTIVFNILNLRGK